MSPRFESAQAARAVSPRTVTLGSERTRNGSALRVVEAPPYFCEDIRIGSEGGSAIAEPHSLHTILPYPESSNPDLISYLIRRYSRQGTVVLDPFCGSGTVGLAANLLGRIAYQNDLNPVASCISEAKVAPADLAEVTLGLQGLHLKRPVEMGPFAEVFQHFYDPETFREIANLRTLLSERTDRASKFVRLLALSILHGPSAGYLSLYTSPQLSLTPEEQREVNYKRRQVPDYRAVMPRILRKAASILRDGIPSVMRQAAPQNRTFVGDARNLQGIAANAVELVVTKPPVPGSETSLSDLWLKLWFLGVPAAELGNRLWSGNSVPEWRNFMNEVCFELARLVKGGGRAAFELGTVRIGRETIELDQELIAMVTESLGRIWNIECVLTHRQKGAALNGTLRSRSSDGSSSDSKIVVLRRK